VPGNNGGYVQPKGRTVFGKVDEAKDITDSEARETTG